MFSLDKQMVKVTGVNLRSERHGEELVSACDIGIAVDLPNTYLAEFHPLLRDSFFRPDDSVEQDMLDGLQHMPLLKFPGFPAVTWPTDLEGYQFIAHYGIGGPSEIKLIDSKIKKVNLTFKEGGTVAAKFMVQAHAEPDEIGKLSSLIQKEVQITLVPPDEAKLYEIEQAKAKRREKLEEHFNPADDNETKNLPLDEDHDPDFDEVTTKAAPVIE